MLRKYWLWIAFILFFGCAVAFRESEADLFTSNGSLAAGMYLVWAVLIAFTAYSVYCSSQENLFRTIGRLSELHWGRQIGLDLYIGLSIFLFVVYLHQQSLLVVLLWLGPALAFVNLATLLYLALHYDSLVQAFLG